MTDWNLWLGIAVGGAFGALGRAACLYASPVPAGGVLLANTLGCLAIGLLTGGGADLPEWLFLALAVGFCGSLTTFSTLCAQCIQRFRQANGLRGATMQLGLHLVLGYAALSLGLAAGK